MEIESAYLATHCHTGICAIEDVASATSDPTPVIITIIGTFVATLLGADSEPVAEVGKSSSA